MPPIDLIEIVAFALVGIINVFLGFLVLARNPKQIINQLFCLIGFSFGIWVFCLLFYEFPIIFDHIFWIKATYVMASLIEIGVLMFSFIFPKHVFKKSWVIAAVICGLFFSLTIYLLYFTNVWILDVVVDPKKGLQTIFGDGYIVWSFAIWIVLGWALINFIYNFVHSKGRQKAQVLYLLFGFGFFGLFATLADIIYPFLYRDTSLFSPSTAASVFFTFSAAYVIIKHRFLDIKFIVARSIAYTLLIAILGAFYISGLSFIGTYFMNQQTSTANLVVSAFLALIMAYSFQPLKGKLEQFTDNIFYKVSYDPNQLLGGISSIMSTNIELKPLAAQIIQTLTEKMKISKGAVVIFGDNLSIYDVIGVNFSQNLTISYQQISTFFPFNQIIVFDEIEEGPLKNLMREMDISVVKILKVHQVVVGVLLLGPKASGEIYSEQDLRVLEIFAPEMAIAIQNSQGYDKIKRFNITLSDEVKKATAELQDANSRLKVLDKIKDDFVSIASHELRTPMTAIRSYAWMALHRADVPLSKNMEKYLARIFLSTERLINLVNDMLNVSRIESERIEINPEAVDLLLLIKDIIDELYYSKSEEKNIQFVVLEKPIPKAFADPEKLRQVFLNLVGNSLKFTPDGGKITFDFFSDGQVVEVSIADTGVGISKEDIGRLFHKFGRLDNSYTASATSGGTGLGLYISKKLVELMHGKIWAQSEGLNKGTTFIVAVPIATPEVLRNKENFVIKPLEGAKELEPVAL